jgi:hypothetical protein
LQPVKAAYKARATSHGQKSILRNRKSQTALSGGTRRLEGWLQYRWVLKAQFTNPMSRPKPR